MNDIVIFGEQDSSRPCLFFDDVIIALLNRDSTTGKNSPGVSIEPIRKYEYNPLQKNLYYGNYMKGSHFGLVYYESDYFLKMISFGLLPSPVKNMPSEWELMIDNAKKGRLSAPYNEGESRSFFFPVKVRINNRLPSCALLLTVNISVLTDNDLAANFPKGAFGLSYANVKAILDRDPDLEDAVYAKMLTEQFDTIAKTYKVLYQLQNLLGLPGVFHAVLKPGIVSASWASQLNYWGNAYQLKHFETPDFTKTVSRGINGIDYSIGVSGGIVAGPEIIDTSLQAYLLQAKDPAALAIGVIKSRPDTNCVAWYLPFNNGVFGSVLPKNGIHTDHYSVDARQIVVNYQLADFPSTWQPGSSGKNALKFSTGLLFSYGSQEYNSPFKKFPTGIPGYSIAGPALYQANLSFGLQNSIKYVYNNMISLDVQIPVIAKIFTQDQPTRLPGLYNNYMAVDLGVDNPSISNDILLFDGVSGGRWKYPAVILSNSVQLPFFKRFVQWFAVGKQEADHDSISFPFASSDILSQHSLTIQAPFGYNLFCDASVAFSKDWTDNSSDDNSISYSTEIRYRMEKKIGILVGMGFGGEYIKLPSVQPTGYVFAGSALTGSILFPGKGDYNTIKIGYFFSALPFTRGGWQINFDTNGLRIFKKYFYF